MEMEKIESILAEYGLTVDTVDFDYAEMDEEALRSAAENYKAASEEVTGDNEQSGEESEPAADHVSAGFGWLVCPGVGSARYSAVPEEKKGQDWPAGDGSGACDLDHFGLRRCFRYGFSV